METEADIQRDLSIAGVDLSFVVVPVFTIKGISQQEFREVGDYGSPYNVSKQAYSFLVSAYDIRIKSIAPGQTFTMTVFSRIFTFKVDSFVEDLTGWVLMQVSMTGNSNV